MPSGKLPIRAPDFCVGKGAMLFASKSQVRAFVCMQNAARDWEMRRPSLCDTQSFNLFVIKWALPTRFLAEHGVENACAEARKQMEEYLRPLRQALPHLTHYAGLLKIEEQDRQRAQRRKRDQARRARQRGEKKDSSRMEESSEASPPPEEEEEEESGSGGSSTETESSDSD